MVTDDALATLADALEAADFPQTAPHVREGRGLWIHLPWVKSMLNEDLRDAMTTEARQRAERALALTIEAMTTMGMPTS